MRELMVAFKSYYTTARLYAKDDGRRPEIIYHSGGAEHRVAQLKMVEGGRLLVVVFVREDGTAGEFVLPYFPQHEVRLVPIEGSEGPPSIGFQVED